MSFIVKNGSTYGKLITNPTPGIFEGIVKHFSGIDWKKPDNILFVAHCVLRNRRNDSSLVRKIANVNKQETTWK